MLGLGRVVTIRKDEKEPRAVFEIEIPFGGLPAAPTPTPTPAPAKAKGAAKP
jgi:hypothetical protein